MLERSYFLLGPGLLLAHVLACNADTFTGTDASTPPDAGNDVTVGGGDSGTADANPGAEGGCVSTFCKGDAGAGATICSDFDSVTDAGTGWSNGVGTFGGWTVGISGDNSVSCPHGLAVTAPTPTSPGDGGPATNLGYGYLAADITYNNTPHLVFDFDVRPLAPTASGQVFSIFSVQYPALGAKPNIGPIFANGWRLQVGSSFSNTFNLSSGTWSHMILDIVLSSNDVTGTLFINGSEVAQTNDNTSGTVPNVFVAAGVQTDTVAPTGTTFYDNIVLKMSP